MLVDADYCEVMQAVDVSTTEVPLNCYILLRHGIID